MALPRFVIPLIAMVPVVVLIAPRETALGQRTSQPAALVQDLSEVQALKANLAGITFKDIYVYDGDTIIMSYGGIWVMMV